MKSRFSFLTAGPWYEVDLPPGFEPVPELSAPVWNGVGSRSFDFRPAARDTGIAEDVRIVEELTDPNGNPVEVLERLAEPPLWYLRWRLRSGSIYTHLREEDGVSMAAVTVSKVEILNAGDLPFLVLAPYFRADASSRPGYQEYAAFHSRLNDRWSVILERPGYLSPGTQMTVPGAQLQGRQVVIRAGMSHGIEAIVASDTDWAGGKELVGRVITSFREASVNISGF
jgi:hypothetical protein